MANFSAEIPSTTTMESSTPSVVTAESLVPVAFQEAQVLALSGEQNASGSSPGIAVGFNAFNTGLQKG